MSGQHRPGSGSGEMGKIPGEGSQGWQEVVPMGCPKQCPGPVCYAAAPIRDPVSRPQGALSGRMGHGMAQVQVLGLQKSWVAGGAMAGV